MKILIRASYPNYQMIRRYAESGPDVFNWNVDDLNNVLEGNKPGTVIYSFDGETQQHEFPPRWYDMFLLLRMNAEGKEQFLRLLLAEKEGSATPQQLQLLEQKTILLFHMLARSWTTMMLPMAFLSMTV